MANVKDYYPGDFWNDLKQTLAWIYARQSAAVTGWQGNALATATTSAQFAECGLVSSLDFSTLIGQGQTAMENIVIDPPGGVLTDNAAGPDGFPINFSPQGLPQGNILLNVLQNSASQTVSGRCFSLLQVIVNYRVDVFSRSDKFYYQGSSSLTSLGGGAASWSVANVAAGAVIAVLYPTTVGQPGVGSSFAALPAGWLAHSNLGVGPKLTNYKAQIYSKTDVEYLQEDNVPIILQDSHHGRAGSSVVPAAGTLTVHILYNDPTSGWTQVFTSLQSLAAFPSLPRSLTVPASDPAYVPDPTLTSGFVFEDRSYLYDCALFILAACAAGNFAAAQKVIAQLNLLIGASMLPSATLENAEDGLTTRWSSSGSGDTITNLNDPTEPPYGTGKVIKFHAANAGDFFTYTGVGFPDSTDGFVRFAHREQKGVPFIFSIGVTTASALVTTVIVTSDPAGPATYNSASKTITLPTGLGQDKYRTVTLNVASLISGLAADTLSTLTSLKATLNGVGDLYLDNLLVGAAQPAGSLSFSYDLYNGVADQLTIRTGAVAWVCYAYALYMQNSLDYSPALSLQAMLNFLLTLQSTDADLRNGLLYQGYGKYSDPGYQWTAGKQTTVLTDHNVAAYFAFVRASKVLPAAATQLLKSGTITSAQSTSLSATGSTAGTTAGTLSTQLLANIYIAPGADPGHFAQGASSGGLDSSQSLTGSGTWAALFCHAIGDDTKATECLKFVYQKFYLANQQVLLSSASASYNQAYQQLQTFSGFKPFNDSSGGYSGAPASVWQEGTWSAILALVVLHDVSTVSSYFATVAGSIDAFLTTLVTGQRLVRSTTGDGSLLGYSLAARGLPWEANVWPGLASTAWWWIASMNAALLLSTDTAPQPLPYLGIPQGQGQSVLDCEGHSSVSTLQVAAIDPGGVLKGLCAQPSLVGRVTQLKLGFAGQALGDFVPLHTLQIVSAGASPEGRVTFECHDLQRFTKEQIWLNGGPAAYLTGQAAPPQPAGRASASNGVPISGTNPRYVQGNPLDIYLVALQNELGVGQDPALPASAWSLYTPGSDTTLINPNPYLDAAGIKALRDSTFSGDWFEFTLTRPVEGKQWLEDQILKVLGLYTIVGSDGKLRLKSMKSPQSAAPVMAFNQKNVIRIPEFDRLPVVNRVTVRMGVDTSQRETAGPEYRQEVTFSQTTSFTRYKQEFKTQVEANGLRVGYGGNLRAFLLADRIFKRYAFATPKYKVQAFLSTVQVELGDLVWLNHPLVPDYFTGQMGLTNVVCEVIGRQPNYAQGRMEFELLDARFMNLTTPYQLAPLVAGVPTYTSATSAQRKQYMFVSLNATGGLNPDGTAGNTVF